MTDNDSHQSPAGAGTRFGAVLRRGRRVAAAAIVVALCGTALVNTASADPPADTPTVQSRSITDTFNADGLGVFHLGVLAAGATVPAGGSLLFTVDDCAPAVHPSVVIQTDGSVNVNNSVPVDLLCHFHGNDINGTASNEATVHVVVAGPGLPHIQDQSRDFVVGPDGAVVRVLLDFLSVGASDPVGRGLTFTASNCVPSLHPQVVIQPNGTVSVNVGQPIDLTCAIRARDTAGQQSNVATLHIRVLAGQPPTVQNQAIAQLSDTDRLWDGVLSRGAVNPAGGDLSYDLGPAPQGQLSGCRYNGGPDRSLVSQPTPGIDHFRVNLSGSAFTGTIVCTYSAHASGGPSAFGTLTISVPALAPTTTTLTPAAGSIGVDQVTTFVASIASSSTAMPTGTVTFLVDRAPFGAPVVVDPAGRASMAVTLGSGIHSVIARYSGDTQHEGSTSVASSIGVRCDVVVSGRHASLVLPRSGSVCLVNATITGPLVVPTAASVDVENSTITGPVTLIHTTGARVCGSRLSNVAVLASAGFVVVGDPSHGCAANVVSGGLVAIGNTHGLVMVDNHVGGVVQTVGNSGSGPLAGQENPVVSGNNP